MKRTISVVLALLFIAAFASAQAKAQLTIICNVSGAQVFLAGQLIGNTNPNLALNIRVGTYPLKIIKKGYVDFDATVTIAGAGAVLQANLVPKGGAAAPNTLPAPNTIAVPQVYNYDLSISSNVTNAEVVINGNHAGQTPFVAQLPNGSYTITVRAPGYLDFNQNVVVNGGPLQVNAMLQGQNYQVSVSANVNGALVFINNSQAGQIPFVSMLPPGSYSILVRAPGYFDYQVQVAVNGPQAINAVLQPQTASWQLAIPNNFVNRDLKPGQSKGVQIWIDNVPQVEIAGPIAASGQLTPGRHNIRLVSGGLSTELQLDTVAGKAYLFEPVLGINVK